MTTKSNLTSRTIASITNTIKTCREQQAMLRANRKAIGAFERKLKIADASTSSTWGSVGYEYVPGHDNESVQCITLNTALYGFPGFKDAALIKLLSRFLYADYTSTKEYAASLNRDYTFWFRQPGSVWIRVRICVYVKADSPTCQKVLVGSETKTIVEDRYEIVCK